MDGGRTERDESTSSVVLRSQIFQEGSYIDVCLFQNAAERSCRKFRMHRDNASDHAGVSIMFEYDVAATLPHPNKPKLLENSNRLSPRQPGQLRHRSRQTW